MVEYSLERDRVEDVVNIVRRSAPLGVSLDKGEKDRSGLGPEQLLGFVSLGFQYLDAQGPVASGMDGYEGDAARGARQSSARSCGPRV